MPDRQNAVDGLGKNSYVQVGLVLVFIGGAFWFGTEKAKISASQAAMSKDIEYIKSTQQDIKDLIQARTESRWTRSQMEAWAMVLAMSNPDVLVPDTNNIPINTSAD